MNKAVFPICRCEGCNECERIPERTLWDGMPGCTRPVEFAGVMCRVCFAEYERLEP